MRYQALTPEDATGLLSLIGLIALFIGLLFLIRHTQRKHLQQAEVIPAAAAKPFPQTSGYVDEIPLFKKVNLSERQAAIWQAFQEWQSTYLLRGLDGNTEFLRGETYKRGLRYQLTSTSLAQGLAMFILAQMAQDGDDSRGSFERLLAHLLAHPAQDQNVLSSWLSLPDLPTSPRLEPDLHAEAWILCALLAAKQQWEGLQRFDLDQIFEERSQAVLEILKQPKVNQESVFSPLLYFAIAQHTTDPTWQTQTELDWRALIPLLREGKELPGRREALSLLQIGLEGLFLSDHGFTERSELAFSRLKRAFSYQENLEGEVEEGFSCLASFCCCAPLALLEKDGTDLDKLWSSLNQLQPDKQDVLGASLRLMAMMSMSGTLWLE